MRFAPPHEQLSRRAFLLAVSSCLAASRAMPAGAQSTPAAAEILELVNRARDALLLPPLEPSAELARAAQAHVTDMIEHGYLEFRSPDGVDIETWAAREGYPAGRVAEKLLETNAPLGDVIAQWRGSPDGPRGSVFADWARHFGAAAAPRPLGDQIVYALVVGADARSLAGATAEALRELAHVRELLTSAANGIRARAGLRALAPNQMLDRVAQEHAEQALEAASSPATRRRRGLDLPDRAAREGYQPRRIAANHVLGPHTVREAAERWLASPEHRDRLLEVYWTDVGNGVALRLDETGLAVSWSQVYANRAGL